MIRFLRIIVNSRNFISLVSFHGGKKESKELETYPEGVSRIELDRAIIFSLFLSRSDLWIAVSVFRNPSSRSKERYIYIERGGDPSREFSRFFLDPRRFRRAHCVTGPHFSARDDYPSVQFMSANDCNLRLIQRCEMVPLALPLARLVARPAEFRLACNKSAKQPKETSGS